MHLIGLQVYRILASSSPPRGTSLLIFYIYIFFFGMSKSYRMLNFIQVFGDVFTIDVSPHDHSQQDLVLPSSFVDGKYLSIPTPVPCSVFSSFSLDFLSSSPWFVSLGLPFLFFSVLFKEEKVLNVFHFS